MPHMTADAAALQLQYVSNLFIRIGARDHGAFVALYQETAPRIFSVTLRMLGNREWAEDVLQEVFVTIWTKTTSFDPAKGAALHWMISVARNKCLDRLRSRRSETPLDDLTIAQLRDTTPGPLDAALCGSDSRALRYCLDQLDTGPREAIVRVYYEGLTHAELAEQSAAPLGTLKSWIRRGLMQLKECLDQ